MCVGVHAGKRQSRKVRARASYFTAVEKETVLKTINFPPKAFNECQD